MDNHYTWYTVYRLPGEQIIASGIGLTVCRVMGYKTMHSFHSSVSHSRKAGTRPNKRIRYETEGISQQEYMEAYWTEQKIRRELAKKK